MVLKRKRSDSEISTSSSLLSSPLSGSTYMSLDSPQSSIPTPSLFASRTRKRHRDNRPSESAVHQHTLSLLYSAQQNPQIESESSTTPFPPPSEIPVSSIPSQPSSQQSSLHSFWSLPPSTRRTTPWGNSSTTTNTPSNSPQHTVYIPATNCEDCNASLNPSDDGDAMDVDMMIMDMHTNGRNYGCAKCSKQVCHGCSVSNLGADRKCLNCAETQKRWQGGLGWVSC